MHTSDQDVAKCPEVDAPSKNRKLNTNALQCSISSCEESFSKMQQLIEHLNKMDNQNLEVQHLSFSTEVEFEEVE